MTAPPYAQPLAHPERVGCAKPLPTPSPGLPDPEPPTLSHPWPQQASAADAAYAALLRATLDASSGGSVAEDREALKSEGGRREFEKGGAEQEAASLPHPASGEGRGRGEGLATHHTCACVVPSLLTLQASRRATAWRCSSERRRRRGSTPSCPARGR